MNLTEKQLIALLPNIAVHMKGSLSNIYMVILQLVPVAMRESEPNVDAKAAMLDRNYYQLLRMVDNLSDAAFLFDDTPFYLKNCDIVNLIGEICDQVKDVVKPIGLKLQFICSKPSHICSLDAEKIKKLLYHLLSNAIKFTSKGGQITVNLKMTGGRILLSVTDNGSGISEELLPTIFNRFLHTERIDPIPHGLGIGLPLCRRIAQGHGGTLLAESYVNHGTRFTLSIPDRKGEEMIVSDSHPLFNDYSGGFNPTLRALADAIPYQAFLVRNED